MKQDIIFARIISSLIHPFLLPTGGLILLFSIDAMGMWIPLGPIRWLLAAATLLATGILPFLNALVLLRMKYITSLEMKTKEERKIPYLVAVVGSFLLLYFMSQTGISSLITFFIFRVTLVALLLMAINIFWKISAHTAGMGAMCGIFLLISYKLQINLHELLMTLFFLSGLVGYARLRLEAHSPAQVYIGFLVGIVPQIIYFMP